MNKDSIYDIIKNNEQEAIITELKIIAEMQCGFDENFGVPRQSGLSDGVGYIVFKKEYSSPEAFREIEGFSHIWLIWGFSENGDKWSPTVRPPRLGGNKRVGVFASRSPFRPNPIGISSVEFCGIEQVKEGIRLKIKGADLKNGTPIYDIKPYLPFTDSHPQAKYGYAEETRKQKLEVSASEEMLAELPEDGRKEILSALSQDPRPHYHKDGKGYTMAYAGMQISFTVNEKKLTITNIKKDSI